MQSFENVRAEIYCGGSYPHDAHATISPDDVRRWAMQTITLPGYTLVPATGIWGNFFEPTTIIIINGPNSPTFRAECRRIAEAYRVAFDQDSVCWAFVPSRFESTLRDAIVDDPAEIRVNVRGMPEDLSQYDVSGQLNDAKGG